MEKTGLGSDMWQEIKRGFNFIFIKDMPLWVAGIGLGILAILIFLWRFHGGFPQGMATGGNSCITIWVLENWPD